MENQDILEKSGLTTNEAKVYIELLTLGSSLASNIAKKSNLHRRPVYDALNRLIEKGLVSYTIKSGKKYFRAHNPERVVEILKDREKEVKQILPYLRLKFNKSKSDIFSEIYEGKEGLKSVMELILKEKKDWLSIGSTGKGPEALPYFLPSWHKRRLKLKIKYKGLIARTKEGRKRAEEFLKIGLAEIKFLHRAIKQPQTIWVFGCKLAIILVSVDHPVIFLIDNREISDSFREYFSLLWKQSKS